MEKKRDECDLHRNESITWLCHVVIVGCQVGVLCKYVISEKSVKSAIKRSKLNELRAIHSQLGLTFLWTSFKLFSRQRQEMSQGMLIWNSKLTLRTLETLLLFKIGSSEFALNARRHSLQRHTNYSIKNVTSALFSTKIFQMICCLPVSQR